MVSFFHGYRNHAVPNLRLKQGRTGTYRLFVVSMSPSKRSNVGYATVYGKASWCRRRRCRPRPRQNVRVNDAEIVTPQNSTPKCVLSPIETETPSFELQRQLHSPTCSRGWRRCRGGGRRRRCSVCAVSLARGRQLPRKSHYHRSVPIPISARPSEGERGAAILVWQCVVGRRAGQHRCGTNVWTCVISGTVPDGRRWRRFGKELKMGLAVGSSTRAATNCPRVGDREANFDSLMQESP